MPGDIQATGSEQTIAKGEGMNRRQTITSSYKRPFCG